ncbi:MAG: universal stress protein [Methanocorpusculum sp.]|nr:universal stress protein [Methanocorpusculum sp.]
MFTKILTAVDGSDISELAVEKAVTLAKQNNAELHLIYVIETGFITPGPGDTVRDLVHKRFEEEGATILEKSAEKAKAAGVAVVSHLEVGHAGNTIINSADKLGCDLIIVGSLGKSKLDRLLLGSVSSHVVNYAKTNILVIRN